MYFPCFKPKDFIFCGKYGYTSEILGFKGQLKNPLYIFGLMIIKTNVVIQMTPVNSFKAMRSTVKSYLRSLTAHALTNIQCKGFEFIFPEIWAHL